MVVQVFADHRAVPRPVPVHLACRYFAETVRRALVPVAVHAYRRSIAFALYWVVVPLRRIASPMRTHARKQQHNKIFETMIHLRIGYLNFV